MEKENLLFKIFTLLGHEVDSIDDLLDITLSQEELKKQNLIHKLHLLIDNLKNEYKSEMLTCLHKNSLEKQKFPAVNMIRQICKCNNLKVSPFVICKGYNKNSGQKITERFYRIDYID